VIVHGGRGTACFAIVDGRFAYVGNDLAAARAAAPSSPERDLKGLYVTPGLADAHTHVAHWARTRERPSFAGITSLDEALAIVARVHAALPPGATLFGEDVPPFGTFSPTREALDRAAPGRAVVLRGRDRHAAWVSSATLAHFGITRATKDPEGGLIGRDARGEPDGLLYENAEDLIEHGPVALDPEALARALRDAAALGLTCIHEFGDATTFAVYRALEAAGRLPIRVAYGVMGEPPLAATDGARLWVFAHKGFVDGTLGSKTAWMLEPFEGTDERGVRTLDDAQLDAMGERARAHGVTLALHAIGDAATRAALDAFARWPAHERERLRPRIEHAQLVHASDVQRFRDLGVIASMQPSHAVSDRKIAAELWGARRGYAWRQLEEAGAVLALGSDAPIESIDPLKGIAAATGDGGLSFERALHGFTAGAAYAVRREHELGRIAPGFRADFVVWDGDPANGAHIVETWVGGVSVV